MAEAENGTAEVAAAALPSSAGPAMDSSDAVPLTAELQALDCSASLSATGGGAEAAPAVLAGSAAAAALAAARAEQTRDAGVLFHFTEPAAAASSAAELAEQQLGSALPLQQQQQLHRILQGQPKPAASPRGSDNDAFGSTRKRINPSALRGGGPLGASGDEGRKPNIPNTPVPAVPSPATVPEVSLSGRAGGMPTAPLPAPAEAKPAGPTPALPAASTPAPPAVGTAPPAAPGNRQPAATSGDMLSSAALPGLVLVLAGQAGLSVGKALWGAGRAALRRGR